MVLLRYLVTKCPCWQPDKLCQSWIQLRKAQFQHNGLARLVCSLLKPLCVRCMC